MDKNCTFKFLRNEIATFYICWTKINFGSNVMKNKCISAANVLETKPLREPEN
jgi:hypothetical protein